MRFRRALILAAVAALGVSLLSGNSASAAPRLSTPWTSQVGPNNALPDYPRPQLTRPDWQNLNGTWQWAVAAAGEAPPIGRTLSRSVLVPYPIESALSGVAEHHDRMWYRRTFTVPAGWAGRDVQLNFGAVDWQADVWINGTKVGAHTGGYTSFSFTITAQLKAGENEIVVGAYDPTDAGGQPVGKQRNSPAGIFYTAYSGIWQTVWLEPTASAHITRLDTNADVPGGRLIVTPQAANAAGGSVRVSVRAGGQEVGSATGAPGTPIAVPIPSARLWSPDDPFLYDIQATLGTDTVTGYAGMRSVGKALVNGVLRPTLNGQFVFQVGNLDQGYWPDGISTAPTDEALKFDIQAQKNLGFNTIRKHIKVEPARWYYWADKLGMLVWQDMPAMTTTRAPDANAKANFESELHQLVDQLRGTTSIVQWVPFNEGWGEYEPARIANLVKGWDPTRLVNNNSGSNCCGFDGGAGDLIDDHIYVGPGNPNRPSATRVAVLGEYGGIGLRVPGHEWTPGAGSSYEMQPDGPSVTNRFLGLQSQVQRLISANGLSAAIYTEITDVENEVNGLYTYDRQVLKIDAARVTAANRALLTGAPVYGSASLPLNSYRSAQVTTPGYTDRFIRHRDGLGFTEHVDAGSTALLKADATWRFVPGLANSSCYSLESKNYPGQYLRHRDSRVQNSPDSGDALMRADATWCARPGLTGSDVSLESYNYPGQFLRRYAAALWLADNSGGGGLPSNASASYGQDVTWHVAPAWAP